jgi:hypothetical protein
MDNAQFAHSFLLHQSIPTYEQREERLATDLDSAHKIQFTNTNSSSFIRTETGGSDNDRTQRFSSVLSMVLTYGAFASLFVPGVNVNQRIRTQ